MGGGRLAKVSLVLYSAAGLAFAGAEIAFTYAVMQDGPDVSGLYRLATGALGLTAVLLLAAVLAQVCAQESGRRGRRTDLWG